jgi:hypothetical protein
MDEWGADVYNDCSPAVWGDDVYNCVTYPICWFAPSASISPTESYIRTHTKAFFNPSSSAAPPQSRTRTTPDRLWAFAPSSVGVPEFYAMPVIAVQVRLLPLSSVGVPEFYGRTHAKAFILSPSPIAAPKSRSLSNIPQCRFEPLAPSAAPSSHSNVLWMDNIQIGDTRTYYIAEAWSEDTGGGTPLDRVRLPIRYWQATIKTAGNGADFLSCVIPGDPLFAEQVSERVSGTNTKGYFAIIRGAIFPNGTVREWVMVTSPIDTADINTGPQSSSISLSGYSTDKTWEVMGATERDLRHVRSRMANPPRMRTAIDWLLRPGMQARYQGQEFTVGFINYYVSSDDAFADIGAGNG